MSDRRESPVGRDRMNALIGRLRKERAGSRPAGIDRRTDPRVPAPLLDAQARLWLLDCLRPGGSVYNMAMAVVLEGPLEVEALAASLSEIVARHEVLRSRFLADAEGEPVQQVDPATPLTLEVRDVADDEREVEAELRALARRPFDLARGPVLRADLLRRRPASHVLVLVLHHVVADGWSLELMMRELIAGYARQRDGSEDGSVALPIQVADVAVWQRRTRDADAVDQAVERARERLGGTPALELPTDRPRLPVLDEGGTRTQISVEAPIADAVRALARRRQTTVFTVLAATWSALLARLSRQTDFALGTPVAGRGRTELESLIGCFVDTRVLRIQCGGDPTLPELLRHVEGQMAAAEAEGGVSFARLVEALGEERTPARTPVFQAMLAMSPSARAVEHTGDLAWTPRAIDTGTAKFDLTLDLADAGSGAIHGALEFRSALFDAETVARWLRSWLRVLAAWTAAPACRLGDLPWLDDQEAALIDGWGRAAGTPAPPRSLTERVREQAARIPDSLAVVCGEERLAYAELEARVAHLAGHLAAAGVGPGSVVGICLGRDVSLPVVLLAVLETGGAYVALDPAYPEARLAQIVADAAPPVVLTRGGLLPATLAGTTHVLDLDIVSSTPPPARHRAPLCVDPEQLAYLIYTSGSTGRPKGVAIGHRSVSALIDWTARTLPDPALAGVAAVTSINFDLSVFELLVPLALGGTVIVCRDALALAEDAARERVRLLNTVPSAMEELVRLGGVPPEAFVVCLAGEPLRRSLVDALYDLPQVEAVWNLYGPSEDTTYSTAERVPRTSGGEPGLGRPIDGTRLHVLDDALRPLPVGVTGEIFLGGAGLAHGYRGRPRRTALGFVPDPSGSQPGGRLYRTGDLARFDATGGLRFLGRADHQVKLRGFRIELGEIEAVLTGRCGAEEAVVRVDGEGGDARLVAYVAPSRDEQSLVTSLAEHLPRHMVPAVVVSLDALPRLPNGKIDRGALPAPDARSATAASRPPEGPLEERLAVLFAEALPGVDASAVGAENDFFSLGGHSLSAARLTARIGVAFDRQVPLATVFERSTVAALAETLGQDEALGRAEAAGDLPRLRRIARDGDLLLSFAQERLWFLNRLAPDDTAYHMAGAFDLRGPLDRAALEAALARVVARHEVLRATFHETDAGPVMRIAAREAVEIPVESVVAHDASARSVAVDGALRASRMQPFRLASGPLLRTRLLRFAPDDHALLLDVHHIVFDGWSVGVLCRELAAGYAQALGRAAGTVPALPFGVADVSAWQREVAGAGGFAASLAARRKVLEGLPPLHLPTDRPRPARVDPAGDTVGLRFSGAVVRDVEAFARTNGTTPFAVFVAAFSALLGRWSGQDDVALGTAAAQREQPELEPLIGLFVNTVVLRVGLEGDPRFDELVARAQTASAEALAHQAVPFEQLVEALDVPRDPSTTPLVQAMVVLQTQGEVVPELPGLVVRPRAVPSQGARLDLTLHLRPGARGGWDGELEYRTSLFDRSTIDQLVLRLQTLLRAAIEAPHARLSALPLPQPGVGVDAESERSTAETTVRRDPSGERERRIASVFASVLGRAEVGAGDDFFALGGHSLLATRVVARLREELGVDLPLGAIFERPTVAQLAASIAEDTGAADGMPTLRRVPRGVDLPLSFAQERLWFLDRLAPDDTAYHMAGAFDLRGPLDVEALESAVADVLERHEVLRTTFHETDATPVMRIAPTGAVPVPVVSVARAGASAREAAIEGAVRAMLAEPFQLDAGPLLRLRLLRFAADDHALVLDVHHIVFDGWSVGVLCRELGTGYARALGHASASPAKLPFGVADVAAWQREVARTGGFDQALAARRSALAGLRPLRLPTDAPRPPRVDPAGDAVAVRVSASLAGRLEALARANGATPFALLAAVFAAQLGRWAGQDDVGLGTAAAQRERPELESLIGLFVNTVVLRIDLSGDPRFTELLGRSRAAAADAIDHQAVPFEQLVETLDLARDPSITPLVQAMLVLQTGAESAPALPGVTVRSRRVPTVGARLDLTLHLRPAPGGGGWVGELEYRTSLFERTTIERLVAGLVDLLTAVADAPSSRLSELPLPAPGHAAGALGEGAVPEGPAHSVVPRRAPEGELEVRIAAIFASVLGRERIDAGEDFFAAGGHSLLATRVVARMRRELGADVPIAAVFERPTVAQLAELVAAGERVAPASIVPVPRDRGMPLSFAQERLWLLDRLDPGNATYNVVGGLRLAGPLDPAALASALDAVVDRHEVLRSVVRRDPDGALVQVASPRRAPSIVEVPAPEDGGQPALDDRATALQLHAFDLEHGPLHRFELHRVSSDSSVLLLACHHIVFDGWSMGLLMRELSAFYDAARSDRAPDLPALRVQYADFAAWQRSQAAPRFEDGLRFWCEALRDLEPLDLPTDHPRPARLDPAGASVRDTWPAARAEAIETFAQGAGVTPFMVVSAAFSAVLGRWAGQDDVALGTPVANRTHTDVEPLIGCFVNTVVLRTDLSGRPSFRALVERVRSASIAAQQHQEVPFEKVVEALGIERDPSTTPVFQVMLVLQTAAESSAMGERVSLTGLEVEPMTLPSITAKHDLTVVLVPDRQGGGFELTVEYRTSLFDEPTVVRLLEHLRTLLDAALEQPEDEVAALPLHGDQERAALLAGAGHCPALRASSIHRRFATVARDQPDAVAIEMGDASLAYGPLLARAVACAHRLRAAGVRPGDAVALDLPRSLEMVIATLGILGAGARYVPLGADEPTARRQAMLHRAEVAWFVVDERHARAREGETGAAAIDPSALFDVVDLTAAAGGELPSRFPVDLGPDATAYVMFTSGSTGEPKGVAVPHRGVLRLALGVSWARLDNQTCIMQLAPTTFDAATLEIWAPLLNGGRVVLAPPGPLSLEAIGDLIARHAVDTMWLTAGLFNQMVDHNLEGLRPLRQLFAGGEALSRAHVHRVLEALPETTLFNGYGPTENTTFTTCHPMTDLAALDGCSSVPIGRAIDGTLVYVLDDRLEPAPVGVPGELWTAGDGLAHGYSGRPSVTASCYVPDPFATSPGGRMYRTGDQARWLADGTIAFLGRADRQIKLRGFRIEPGEIESALVAHPSVSEAAVLASAIEGRSDQRLVAYVVPASQLSTDGDDGAASISALDTESLKHHLAGSLPGYMVPSAIAALPALPLNKNGKLDRAALPAPRFGAGEAHEPPGTETEVQLAALYEALLGVDAPSATADFFALGGHSLLATQLVSRIRDHWGVELPLAQVFEHPTVRSLASVIDGCGADGADARALARALPPITPVPEGEALPLALAQARLWFLDQLEGSVAYHIPLAVRLAGALDPAVLERALGAVVARHAVLRTVIGLDEEALPVQVVREGPVMDWRQLDLPASDPDALEAAIREAAAEPFDLAEGPLVRARLLRTDERRHVLAVVLHHIVADGWSLGILVHELGACYRAFSAREAPSLPPLPVQYGDYAHWQRLHLEPRLDRQLEHWRARLAGLPVLELPTDRPRPPIQQTVGDAVPARIDPELLARIDELAAASGTTRFMVLLAAFQGVLGRWSGQTDFAVGTPVAGRTHSETESLIGCFVNTLVLRADLAGSPSLQVLLERVRATVLEAQSYQDLPFERLVSALETSRDRSRPPLCQVILALQGDAPEPLSLPGVDATPLVVSSKTAKVDLYLALGPSADGGLEGELELATALFDRDTASRLLVHFVRLLDEALRSPDRPLASLPLMTSDERRQVVEGWNGPALPATGRRSVDRWIADRAAQCGDVDAVVGVDETLTYAELDGRASQLARHLRGLGVGVEDVVGVCLDRTPSLVVTLVAVHRAGAAYLALDPAYPAERLAFILEDAGAGVVVSRGDLVKRLPVERLEPSPAVVDLDRDRGVIASRDAAPLDVEAPYDRLCYLLYTSGSTGRPKGVAVAHQAVVALCTWARQVFDDDELGGLLATTSINFDLSVFELFAPLMWGGTIVLADDLLAFPDHPAKDRVRLVNTVPSTLNAVPADALPESVRTVAFCGEPLRRALVERCYEAGAEAVYNLYGPSEDTTYSTWVVVPPGLEHGEPTIGVSLPGTRAYVLDDELQPVPVGLPGELWLAGAGLARGYRGRYGLSAERFVPDPYAPGPGQRMYRTGDRVRWASDGQLLFLGRTDHQLKIRGFRIEPGEIEAVLVALPEVAEALVAPFEVQGDLRLAAWLAPTEPDTVTSESLARALAEHLPGYMVPSVFVLLDVLPKMPNGKIDRHALPAPEATASSGVAYEAPQTPTEEQVAALFAELLGVDPAAVGRQHDFFGLGGHSLLATQLVSRLRESFSVPALALEEVFAHASVADLALVITQMEASATDEAELAALLDELEAMPVGDAGEGR